mmetsp:Transcript_13801/g.50258  ORF Transcript_13801/g.50258 Transcript_13801/m.50258 type:complete len:388 (-) Transcript_13801:2454-3617(-)
MRQWLLPPVLALLLVLAQNTGQASASVTDTADTSKKMDSGLREFGSRVDDHVCYTHVKKSAGTQLVHVLERLLRHCASIKQCATPYSRYTRKGTILVDDGKQGLKKLEGDASGSQYAMFRAEGHALACESQVQLLDSARWPSWPSVQSNASDLGAAWLMTSLRHPVDRIRSHYHYKFHKTHQWLDYDPDSAASTDTQDGAPESSGGYVVQGNEHLTSPSITQPWEHEGMTVRQYYGGVITLEEFARTPGKDNQHVRMLSGQGWTNLNDDGQQMASPEDAALLAMKRLRGYSYFSLAEKWNVSMQMLKVQLFPRAFSTVPEGMLAGEHRSHKKQRGNEPLANSKGMGRVPLPDSLYKSIAAANAADMQLHEFALQEFDRRCRLLQLSS